MALYGLILFVIYGWVEFEAMAVVVDAIGGLLGFGYFCHRYHRHSAFALSISTNYGTISQPARSRPAQF